MGDFEVPLKPSGNNYVMLKWISLSYVLIDDTENFQTFITARSSMW